MATIKTATIALLIAASTCSLLLLTEAAPPPVPEPFAFAPSPEPFPGYNALVLKCYDVLLNKPDCFTYLTAGNNMTKPPEKACCPEFAQLMKPYGFCMCFLFVDQLPSYCGASFSMARCSDGDVGDVIPLPVGGDDYNNGVSSGVEIYALVVLPLFIYFAF